ncbi:MAG: SPFH domain-containing protein [Polyangiaceae bacterium]
MKNIPRWGRVTAEPHEYLIQIKNGRVKAHGQGISVFKWPSDSIAILPTSIAKLQFVADQVTREKVGVEVRGLAVYRIVEPLLAYRMIDTDRGALTDILREMFVGATRRIVSSLTLEECLTHRKERVGAALMKEITPVLAGEGADGDATHQGWGVVLDTIEIQDVKVLSQEVFTRLQAPFREELSLKAMQAKDSVLREEARLTAERNRAAENAARELMAEQEKRLLAERQREIEAGEHRHRYETAALQSELQRSQQRAEADRVRALMELQTRKEAAEMDIALEKERRQTAQELTEAQLQEVLLTQTLPALAAAFRGSFDRVNVTAGDGAQLFGFLSAGVEQVMEVARKSGASLPAKRNG